MTVFWIMYRYIECCDKRTSYGHHNTSEHVQVEIYFGHAMDVRSCDKCTSCGHP